VLLRNCRRINLRRIGSVIAAVMLGDAIEKHGGHDVSPLVCTSS